MLDAGPLLISELLAFNDDILTDADGDYSDWLEIHNPTHAAVELDGWYLTDDAGDLKKWQFPDLTEGPEATLEAGGYLVVFASGKDRVDPLQELHTNFNLAGAGEYLALVRPDGETVSHAYAPEYPPQAEDWSYGITADLDAFFVPAGSALSYRVPTSDDEALGTAWTSPDFGDSDWTRHGEASEVLVTEISTGSDDYLEIQNVAKYPINTAGWTVAINQPGDAGILDVHPVQWELPTWMEVDEVLYRSDDDGEPDSYWGDDIVWKTRGDGWVMILDDQGRVVDLVFWGYSPEEIATLDVTVGGFHITADGAWSGSSVPAEGSRSNSLQRHGDADHHNATDWSFTTPQSPGEENEALATPFSRDVSVAMGFSTVASSIADAVQIDIETQMHQVNSSLYVRYPFYVDDPATLSELQLHVQYNDGFVAYLNGQEVARRNAPQALAWDSAATAARSADDSVVFEEIDLADFRDNLLGGTNVLAIHGLNFGADDADFLILPEVGGKGIRYFAEPTPGEENGIGTPRMGPVIRNVTEDPPPPAADEPLVITADVGQTFYVIDQVTLHYRIDFDNEIMRTMVDDGSGRDAVAGDEIYTATIDANAYGPGDMVRWRVTADDSAGRSSTEPAFLDQDGRSQSPEYYGTVVVDPSITNNLPILHWFAQNPSAGHNRGGTRTSVFFDGRFYDNAFVRQRGGATNNYSQKFDFNRGAHFYVNDEIGTVQEFNLNAQGSDPAYLRQAMAFQTFPAAGNDASESFLMPTQLNGRFDRLGIFIEQVDDEFLDRVGLDPEGALYKFVQRSNLDPVFSDTTTGIEKKTRLGEDFSDVQSVVDGLTLPTQQQRQQFVFDNFNLPQLLNYLSVRTLIQDTDDVRKNFYLYRDTNGSGEWSIFPWDKDWTFGVTGDGGTQLTHPFFGDYAHRKQNANQWNRLYEAIFNDPVTQEMYLRRLRSVMDELLQPPGTPTTQRYFEHRVDEMVASLRQHISLSTSVVNSLKGYFPTRRTQLYVNHSIDNWTPGGNIAGIPYAQVGNPSIEFGAFDYNPASGDQDEEYLELVNNNATAVDVSGWQLDGGVNFSFLPGTVIPAGGSLYVSPDVRAFRSRAEGPSGGQSLFVQGGYRGHLSSFGETIRLVAADGAEIDSLTYAGDPSGPQQFLRVSEIMYNPAEPKQAEIDAGWIDNDDFEFIELINTGSETLNLEGVHFASGVEFAFDAVTLAAGQRVVVAGNAAAFAVRYGAATNLAGSFSSGRLDNGGEVIKLDDRLGSTILQLRYNDGGQWPSEADGDGPSLEILDPTAAGDNPDNWQYSTRYGGSPGAPAEAVLGVSVNEVLSHTDAPRVDAVELVNTTDQAIDLGGWYLSDSGAQLTKYRIADGTVIPAGGYRVFDERDFNPTPTEPGPTDFALNGAHGDDVWLVKADAGGNPTHIADHVEFAAAAEGESWGRWPDAQGDLYPMITPTLDPADGHNAGPRIGPVLISEVHYNDADGGGNLEFVEIHNPTEHLVELDNWRLRKGIDFDFAEGTVLTPGATLLVLPFDPQDPAEAGRLSDFLAHYQLETSVPMVGGYSGNLDNAGDRVQLQRPDAPIAAEENFIPHLLEDEVAYGDVAPWPVTADGQGDSLQRLGLGRWGNDPSSWTAASPSPGTVDLAVATIAARHVFYNNSAFDGTGDDDAIAPDKEALLPGGRATYANYTSYSAGINGVAVDVHSLAGTPAAADFEFRFGNDNDPSGWPLGPSPQSVTVRTGAGVDGSDRVTIFWPDHAIRGLWMQVSVRATAATGLAEDDVFYFGNAPGEAGNSTLNAIVNTTDEVAARNFQHGPTNLAAIDDPYDYNRDRLVNATDRAIARGSQTGPVTALRLITAPARGTALAQVAADGLNSPATLSQNLAWLSQPEQATGVQATDRHASDAQAVDVLLAVCDD